jgi:hypothetical protein
MTQTHPESRTAPWTPAPRGVHWADGPARPTMPVPPAGLGWSGYGWAAPQAAPPGRSGMRWGWIVLGVVAAVVAVAIIGSVARQTSKMTINGSVTVYGAAAQSGAACQNTSMTGKPISIFGSNGDLVGTTSLTGYGVAVNQWNVSSYANYADSCRFSFTLTDVTAADDYYRVTTGSDVSDSVGFSKEQLEASGANITYGHG